MLNLNLKNLLSYKTQVMKDVNVPGYMFFMIQKNPYIANVTNVIILYLYQIDNTLY